MSRVIRAVSVVLALALLAGAFVISSQPQGSVVERGEIAERRLNARARLHNSVDDRAGLAPVNTKAPGPKVDAPGWGDEQVFSNKNDWEPNVAADAFGYVYILTTQYGGKRACDDCPRPAIRMRVSSDGGHTFGPQQYLCACEGKVWQADPIIDTDAAGNVYAAWLTNPFGTVFAKSTDHGQTWTEPVAVMPKGQNGIQWNDHPWMAVSADGQDVYIGANQQDNYQVSSHDSGVTWGVPVQTNEPGDYYFAVGAVVLDNGDVIFSDAAFSCCGSGSSTGPVDVVVIRSTDDGATWTETVVDTSKTMPDCTSYKCPKYQYGTEVSVAKNGDGIVALAYTVTRKNRGWERLYTVTSADNGVTWSEPMVHTPNGVMAVFPQIAGGADGRFSVAWADNRKGTNRFNTYVSDSFDSGATWAEEVRVSNVGHGAGYKHPGGYQFSYGDYFDIVINNQGEAFSAWGEGYHYWGPGGTWYNVQEGDPTPAP